MKTLLIQLEKFDNCASACEKIKWAKSGKVLLIWPKRGRLQFSEFEIELIRREADSQGVDIALVTRDPIIEEFARELEISSFKSVPLAENLEWIPSRNRSAFHKNKHGLQQVVRKNSGIKVKANNSAQRIGRILAIISAGLAIISIFIFLIPSATVTVYPQVESKQISINIWASQAVEQINLNGSLPATLKTIELSRQIQGQSSGVVQIARDTAEGQVTFTNLSGNIIMIPLGTIVRAEENSGISFSTIEESIIEPGPSSITVKVKAVQAGASGNLEANRINEIDGPLGIDLEVTNESPTSGGSDVQAPSPTEDDYAALKDSLLKQLFAEANQQLQSLTGQKLIEGTLIQEKIISETRSVDVGDPADTFLLTLIVEFQGLIYSPDELQNLIEKSMQASLGQGQSLYGEGMTILSQSTPRGSIKDGMKWTIVATSPMGNVVPKDAIIRLISGKNKLESQNLINNFMQSRQTSTIDISPKGWKFLPWAGFRIRIEAK